MRPVSPRSSAAPRVAPFYHRARVDISTARGIDAVDDLRQPVTRHGEPARARIDAGVEDGDLDAAPIPRRVLGDEGAGLDLVAREDVAGREGSSALRGGAERGHELLQPPDLVPLLRRHPRAEQLTA